MIDCCKGGYIAESQAAQASSYSLKIDILEYWIIRSPGAPLYSNDGEEGRVGGCLTVVHILYQKKFPTSEFVA